MKVILIIDACINAALGALLLLFSPILVESLGVPEAQNAFYPNILGAVFIAIAVALCISAFGGTKGSHHGLGFWGAVSINLCGGSTLALWLIFGDLGLPVRGTVFLWLLVGLLIGISAIELLLTNYTRSKNP